MKKFAVALAVLVSTIELASPIRAQAPPKATDYPAPKPAFPGQTGAPAPQKASPPLAVETVVSRLDSPWAMAFLPNGDILVTARNGEMRIAGKDRVLHA